MCSITGMGEKLHKVLGQIGSKLWFPWQQKPPLTYNGENNVSTFSRLFFIWSFLYSQVTRTCIKSRTSSNFCQIGPLTTELYALERSHWLWMGKMVSPFFSVAMNSDFIKLTGNEDRHKILDRFEFWSYLTSHLGFAPALQQWKKWCLQLFSVTFDWVFVKLAGNEDRHKKLEQVRIWVRSDYSLWSYLPLSTDF